MLQSLKRSRTRSNEINAKVKKYSEMSQKLKEPVKSDSDKKEYRLIQLPNGLKSLLVQHFLEDDEPLEKEKDRKVSEVESMEESAEGSDEGEEEEDEEEHGENSGEKMAAVALCVDVGSWQDPQEIQGLSHFLEHMIFMGSKKFPKENEFDQFVSTNGGADNAMTEVEYTMFYFEIVEEHLAGAIERFANLFIEPLMLRDAMEREMEAVESEFQNTINDDDTRIMQLCASYANGPFKTFTWGNLKTLKEGISNDELYEAVHAFRRKHYIANRMWLCVESAECLDDIQKLVEKNFSGIQSGPEPELLPAPLNPFKPEFHEKVFYVKPKADKIKLYLTFLLPSMEKHYRSKPHDYLAYIIQHEGVGSLSSYLKRKLLALRVEAGSDDQSFEGNSFFMLFSIVVTLTEDGYSRIEEVLEAIFSFLLLLKETPISEHEKSFMELKQIKDTSFKYREEKTSTDNVEEMVVNMKYYANSDILTGSDLLFEFDEKLVGDLIEKMNERKFNLLLLTDKHEKYENIEKWFGTEYDVIDFPENFTNLWNNRKLKSDFSMPPPNNFICTNFDIIAKEEDPMNLPQYPEKILANEICECFYKLDGRFKLPHAIVCLYIVSPKTVASVRGMVMTSLYSMIVKHYMAEKLYPAICAGLGYQMSSEEKGFVLKFSGYNEKLPILIDIVTKDLKTISSQIEPSVFETYKKQFKKFCYNNLISSKNLNKECRINIIEEHHKFLLDRHNLVHDLKFDEFVEFSSTLLDQLRVQILVQGNLTKSTAEEVAECVLRNLNCGEIDQNQRFESRAAKLPKGTHVLKVKSILPNDKNSTTTNYIQIGSSSIRLQCLIEIVEKIMEEPLFDVLRTHEQLGYSVSGSHRFNFGILGLSITVQSQEEKNPTKNVDKRIEGFLKENLLKIMEDLSDDEFVTIQTALIKLKNMVDVELDSEVGRNWSEIVSKEFHFNRLELEAEMIARITKQEVVDFYKTKILDKNAKKLSIQIIGAGDAEEVKDHENQTLKFEILEGEEVEGQKMIKDIEEFKNSLEMHPVTYTKIDL